MACFLLGWVSNFDDVHNWTAYSVRRHRTNLHGPQVTELQSCGTSTYEVNQQRYFTLTQKPVTIYFYAMYGPFFRFVFYYNQKCYVTYFNISKF